MLAETLRRAQNAHGVSEIDFLRDHQLLGNTGILVHSEGF